MAIVIHPLIVLTLHCHATNQLGADVSKKSFFLILLLFKNFSHFDSLHFNFLHGFLGFDPLGFSNLIDVKWLREAELKHCRICMLAVVGFVASGFVQLPGEMHQVRTSRNCTAINKS